MALDLQALAVAGAGVLTAIGAVATGLQTGRNGRAEDRRKYESQVETFRQQREAALELASKDRIEAIAADAATARARLRETETEHYRELQAKQNEIRTLQADRQRGWDLARIHFNFLGTVVHIVLNVFQFNTGDPADVDKLQKAVSIAQARIKSLDIPRSLEEPIPAREGM